MGLQDDLVYVAILVGSFGFAHLSKHRTLLHSRDVFNGLVGLGLVGAVCGVQLLYSLLHVLGTLALVRLCSSRHLLLSAFGWGFGWLTWTRFAAAFGAPALLPHANAVQLVMTLRVIGLAAEISDGRRKEAEEPSLRSQFLYCYNFVGLFTGPYYTFRVHRDMVQAENLAAVPVGREVSRRLCAAPVYAALFLLLRAAFPLEAVRSEAFYSETTWLWRLLYMVPSFHALKLRCYVAWQLAEAVAITNGLGAYPVETKPRPAGGPTLEIAQGQELSGEVSWETVRNVDPYNVELSRGFRSGMRSWNRSVQYWLATYVYARAPRPIRLVLTMSVSAVWHGLHLGYAVSFLTVPLCTAAEDAVASLLSPPEEDGDDSEVKRPADFLWWFVRERSFEYMGMGFLLVNLADTWRYFASTGFAMHLVVGGVLVWAKVTGVKPLEKPKRS